jgi:hypothetical protein
MLCLSSDVAEKIIPLSDRFRKSEGGVHFLMQ